MKRTFNTLGRCSLIFLAALSINLAGCKKPEGASLSDQMTQEEAGESLNGSRDASDLNEETKESKSLAADDAKEEVKDGGEDDPGDVLYLSMATSGNWDNILRGKLWDKYCRKLSIWTGGKIVINSYFDGKLGGDLQLLAGVIEGTLCIINSVPSYQFQAVPEAALLDIPGLFENVDEYNYFIDNYYMETLQSYYEAKGIHLLTSSAFDYRMLTSNTPVHSLEDLKGLKLRTMENKYHMAFWEALGANPVPMKYNEVKLALQQDLLQAQENPLAYVISSGLSEVQSQAILTNHILMINNYLMNKEQYDALTEDEKASLARFFREMNKDLVDGLPEENQTITDTLKAANVEIYPASTDIQEAIIEQGQPAVISLLKEDLGEEKVDNFLTRVEEAKKSYKEANENS